MQITLIVLTVLIVVIIALRFYAMAKMKNTPLVADNTKILTLTTKNFPLLTKNKVVLVDFWASWCAPCRMMVPVLNEVASGLSSNAHVGKVDIQKYDFLARKYKVRNIPTMILFKNGTEVNRFVGVKSKDFLLKEISKISK
jgi:thioredoxin 1